MTQRPLGRRPSRALKEGKSGEKISLGLRVTGKTKNLIDAGARESGRTQSEEAAWRIERSFDHEGFLPDTLKLVFGDLSWLVLAVAYAMQHAGRHVAWSVHADRDKASGDAWLADPTAYDAAVKRANEILELARPTGKVQPYTLPPTLPDMIPLAIEYFRHLPTLHAPWRQFDAILQKSFEGKVTQEAIDESAALHDEVLSNLRKERRPASVIRAAEEAFSRIQADLRADLRKGRKA